LFITPALVFSFPGAYWLGPLILAALGVYMLVSHQTSFGEILNQVRKIPALWGFMIFAILHAFLTFFHGEPVRDFGNIIPFLLSPLILIVLLKTQPSSVYFWLGCAAGALLACVIGIYQVYFLEVGRAYGFRNPIMFGNTAIVLGTGALIGFVYCKNFFKTVFNRFYLLLGGLAGLFTSLLSGTKGGWISLIMILVMFVAAITRSLSSRFRNVIAVGLVLFIVLMVFAVPKMLVVDRIVSGYHGGIIWLQTGEITEGSVSIRLEAIKAGLIAGSASPLLGPGQQGAKEIVANAARAGLVDKEFFKQSIDPHNDLVSVFSKHGLVGVLSVLAVHFGIFFTFWGSRKQSGDGTKALSTMGILLVLLYFEFGLSISVFGTAMFRTVYIFWSALLVGLLIVEQQRLVTCE
jgi:O-antigen ligase